MRLTSFVVLRSWASSLLRPALAVLGVALGIAIVVAIHVVDHNTVQSQILARLPDFGRVDMELMALDPGRPPELVRTELGSMPEVAEVGILHAAPARLLVGGAEAGDCAVFGLAPLGRTAFGHYRVVEGDDLTDLDGDQSCLVGNELAARLRLKVGDRITLINVPGQARYDCVDGRAVQVAAPASQPHVELSMQIKGLLAGERLGRQNSGQVLVAGFGAARRLAPGAFTFYHVNRRSGVDPEKLAEALRPRYRISPGRTAMLGEAADERAFRNGVKVLGMLALVLGMFVIFNTLSQSLVERLKQIGILRCLGAGRAQIAGIFLSDATALSLCGALLGVILGLGLAYLLIQFRITTLGTGKRVFTFDVPFQPVAAVTAMGVLFTLVGAAFPLVKARRLSPLAVLSARDINPPADFLSGVNFFLFILLVGALPLAYFGITPLLREEGSEATYVLLQAAGIIAAFFGVLLLAPRLVRLAGGALAGVVRRLLPLAVFLVRRELARSPGRIASSVCGLSVVCLAFVCLNSVTESLKGEIRQFAAVAMADRLFVKCRSITREQLRQLDGIDGVAAVEAVAARIKAPYDIVGVDLEELRKPGGLLERHPSLLAPMQQDRGALVSRRLAALKHLHVGGHLDLPVQGGVRHYPILAICDDVGFFPDERGFAAVDREWLRRDACVNLDLIDRISLRLLPGADLRAVTAAVRNRLPEAEPGPRGIRPGAEVESFHLYDVDRDFVLFDVLLGLILVLAGVGLVNAMTIAALARTKEFGVLSALGMSRGGMFAILAVEAGVVGLLAGAVSLLLSLPTAWVVVHGLRVVSGLDVPFTPPWRWVAAVPLLAFATALLASVFPALRLRRISPAQAVRYE